MSLGETIQYLTTAKDRAAELKGFVAQFNREINDIVMPALVAATDDTELGEHLFPMAQEAERKMSAAQAALDILEGACEETIYRLSNPNQ